MDKQEIYSYLNEKNIWHEITEHKAVYNMADLADVEIPYPDGDAKNIFIRDDKKKNFYLITVKGDKRVDLKTFRKFDSYLEGHPSIKINGVDVSSGSLGQGLSIANGMAISKKVSGKEGNVYCLVGDGEIEEGQIWEACMSSSIYNLNNLILFVDNNGLQIDGTIKDVKNVDNLEEKFNSFGFYVQRINGHNFDEILTSVSNAKKSNKPNVIIANTIKGKGISFMENKAEWHGKKLTDEEYNLSKAELK